ncbi:PduL/EutD family phosphate acyltransferase [Candidatus Symbiopectobacterium endolongispinus]|uniref:PduL/EutD family phosphate acyltransferase n=1 Tax=Candidatus Symbiopectobacterium endolongispinus TaxID=2812664 RepID=UPI003F688E96|nr:hypothetical protein [Candidatus Symbiopectobacterium endolongispinus]
MNATQQQIAWITQQVMQELAAQGSYRAETIAPLQVPVGISNRHIHLAREDMDILFGYGATLTRMKAVKQPGQFAGDFRGEHQGDRQRGGVVRSAGDTCGR